MNREDVIKLVCNTMSEVTDNNFPCICGENPLGGNLRPDDIVKINKAMEILIDFKEEVNTE